MNVKCASCSTQYQIDATKVPAGGGFIRCKTCGERVRIPPPGSEAPAAPVVGMPGADAQSPDATRVGGTTEPLSPDAPKTAIPLGGTPGDEAPTAVTTLPSGSIPLAGTPDDDAPTQVTSSPSSGVLDHDLPASPASEGIPLAGSVDQEAPTDPVEPRPEAAHHPAEATEPVEPRPEAAHHPAEAQEGPAPGAIPLSGIAADAETDMPTPPVPPAPPPTSTSVPPPTSTPAPPPDFLDDLPATLPTSDTPGQEDLPPLDREGVTVPDLPPAPTSQHEKAETVPDLPAPVLAPAPPEEDLETPHDRDTVVREADMSLFEDLPTVESGASSVTGAHPLEADAGNTDPLAKAADAIPADPGPLASFPSGRLPSDSGPPATESPAFDDLPTLDVEAPRLMEDVHEGDTFPAIDSASLTSAPQATAEVHDLAPTEPIPGQEEPSPLPAPSRTRTYVLASLLGVVVLLGGASVLVGPTLLGLETDATPAEAVEPLPQPMPPPPDQEGTPPDPPSEVSPEPPETAPEPPATPVLTGDNVDTLPYAQLKAATEAHAEATAADAELGQALLAWAHFRLASTFGDVEAGKALTEKLPKPKEIGKLNDVAAAAAIGALAHAGKASAARRVGERLQRGKLKGSPRLALALATTYTRRPDTPKAVRQLERALKAAPRMEDAQLARGRLLLEGRDAKEGIRSLLQVAATSTDPDTTLRSVSFLLAAGQLEGLDSAVATLTDVAQAESVAPTRKDDLLELLVRKRVRAGDFAGAVEAAETRMQVAPTDTALCVEHARLVDAAGRDGDEALQDAVSRSPAPAAKARLMAERIRLALEAGKADQAGTMLEEGRTLLKGEQGAAWLKLAEGWIAARKGETAAARAAFRGAARGKDGLPEAKLADALLTADKPGPLMRRLTELSKKQVLPEAFYHLARVLRERGNIGGAVQLLDRLLWVEPTAVNPIDLLLEWADLLSLSGRGERARPVVAALHNIDGDDPRPIQVLIDIARRAKRFDDAIHWSRALVKLRPDELAAKISLAGLLVEGGRAKEAQTMLTELFKTNPDARTPDAIIVLARAWIDREPFKAKDLLKEAVDLDPQPSTYLLLANLEVSRGRTDAAKVAFKKALELDPKALQPRVAMARILLDERSADDAATILNRVLTKDPKHVEATELLGDTMIDLGKPREAINRYNAALQHGGDKAPLIMKVARIQLQQLGQLAVAAKSLRRAINADPEFAEPHYYLGLALKDLDKPDEAKQELLSYIRMAPDGEFANDARRIVDDLEKL